MSSEDRNAFYRRLHQRRYEAEVERGKTVGLDGLVDLVTRWRGAADSGIAMRNIVTRLAQEDGVCTEAIQARLGKAVGLGFIAESELPTWKGLKFRRSIDFHRGSEE